jgi:hypothetical protein
MASLPKPAVGSKLEELVVGSKLEAFLDRHKFNLRNLLKLTEDAFQELLQDEEFEYLTEARKQILIRDWGVQKARLPHRSKSEEGSDEDQDHNAIPIKCEGPALECIQRQTAEAGSSGAWQRLSECYQEGARTIERCRSRWAHHVAPQHISETSERNEGPPLGGRGSHKAGSSIGEASHKLGSDFRDAPRPIGRTAVSN